MFVFIYWYLLNFIQNFFFWSWAPDKLFCPLYSIHFIINNVLTLPNWTKTTLPYLFLKNIIIRVILTLTTIHIIIRTVCILGLFRGVILLTLTGVGLKTILFVDALEFILVSGASCLNGAVIYHYVYIIILHWFSVIVYHFFGFFLWLDHFYTIKIVSVKKRSFLSWFLGGADIYCWISTFTWRSIFFWRGTHLK